MCSLRPHFFFPSLFPAAPFSYFFLLYLLFSLISFLKETVRFMTSPSCPCVSPKKLLNQSVDLHEVQWGDHAIEDDIDAIIFMS
jgi:hypothetical protein